MAPDWSVPIADNGFLIEPSSELLKPEAYAELARSTHFSIYTRYAESRDKVKELVAQDFPPRKEGVHVETSGPQGSVVPFTIIDDPADWKSTTWAGREAEYTYYFTEQDLAELDAAVKGLRARGLDTEEDIKKLTRDDFPLPKLGPKLVELAKAVNHGRGFQFLKGFPAQKYKEDPFYVIAAYWGLGLHVGRTQINQTDYDQNTGEIIGSVLNHIVNKGFILVEGVPQPHQGKALPFHADQGATDIISLLAIGAAQEGGAAKWVSSIAIHNELLRRGRKDLVEVLSQPFKLRKMVTQVLPYRNAEGHYEFEEIVPFQYHDGYLSVYFQALTYYDLEWEGQKLTPLQEEAIWAVLALAERPEFHFYHTLQPGDIEWIHNLTIWHAREPYVDGVDDDNKRHLVRLWLHSDNNKRPIAPSFAPRSSVQASGGFKVPAGAKIRLPVTPVGK